MRSALIVGSGPAAAGVALALTDRPGLMVTVVDIGAELGPEAQALLDHMAALSPTELARQRERSTALRPELKSRRRLPEKTLFGSDFAFADKGQRRGLTVVGRTGDAVVSGAYGGFSNVWGAQLMPFSAASFSSWPVSAADMGPHYRAICEHVPLAGEVDDLCETFPYHSAPVPLPPLSPRTVMVLSNYVRHRQKLRRAGVSVGHARLALRAGECVRCGMCMTGCPYSLIYSASQTFDVLRAQGKVDYRSGLVVHRVAEDADQAVVEAREMRSGRVVKLHADRAYLACGAIGTTRLVLGSLGLVGREVTLSESAQFFFPTLSARAAPDPRGLRDFTLGQFNVIVDYGKDGPGTSADLAQVQFYPYNPTVAEALPKVLTTRLGQPLATQALSRLSIGLGYLPSWASPKLRARVTGLVPGDLPSLRLEADDWSGDPPVLTTVLRTLLRSARSLDLWPIVSQVVLARGAMSYHLGGSFPHRQRGAEPSPLTTDRLGRLPAWGRVHLVDGSVFPTVPATTFVLTLMANAHRVATESLALLEQVTAEAR